MAEVEHRAEIRHGGLAIPVKCGVCWTVLWPSTSELPAGDIHMERLGDGRNRFTVNGTESHECTPGVTIRGADGVLI